MKKEFKTLEDIKNEVANNEEFDSFRQMAYADAIYESTVDWVAKRFSQQYIDANKELVEMLERIIDAQYNPKKSLNALNATIDEAKSLITKFKE